MGYVDNNWFPVPGFHKSSLLWQLIWMKDTSDYYIKARKGAKLYLGLGSTLSASGLAIHMIYYQFLRILDKFWSNDLDLSRRKVKII